jgi:poly-beta-hydroxybutyrate-responsive repressor
VAGLDRNGWPLSIVTPGRFAPVHAHNMFEGRKTAKNKLKECGCPSAKMTRFIEPCLLFLLSQRPSYGYELIDKLDKSGFQKSKPDPAMVYRTLRSLEKDKCVISKWDTKSAGPAKRNYELTQKGFSLLHTWVEGIAMRKQVLEKFLRLYEDRFSGKSFNKHTKTKL